MPGNDDPSSIGDSFLRELARAPDVPIDAVVGHFRIVARIGVGGMGVVYRATDEKLGRDVALKLLPADFTADEERRRRFLREARSAAAVAHANIVTVYEVGEAADGRIFIAMELVDGESLRARLSRGPLGVSEAHRVATDVARGLAKAHAVGIVHRDLKPDNVMITSDGHAKILDFGLAKLVDSVSKSELEIAHTASGVTEMGRMLGTPAYMSPEQAKGKVIDARSDVFAFGVVAYEMITGRRPFTGESLAELLIAIDRDPPPPIAGVQSPLVRVVERCLRKPPVERYADGGELVRALEGPVSARGAPRIALVVAAIVGAGALATAAAGTRLFRREAPTPTPVSSASAPLSSSAPAAPSATTLTDLPLPATTVSEARSEYAAGMQAQRDDNWRGAFGHFERAVALDPSMAAGYFRVALTSLAWGSFERGRAAFAKATALRAGLSERDQVLLQALEPLLARARADRPEAVRRLSEAHDRYPFDVEFLDWLGLVSAPSPAGLAAAKSATRLDPKDGNAWEDLGRSSVARGLGNDARNAFQRCADIAIDASDCFYWLALVDMIEGRCADFERNARRSADTAQHQSILVARAMVAMGRPDAAVRDMVAQYVAGEPETDRASVLARQEAKLAMHGGRFDAARDWLAKEAIAIAANAKLKTEFGWNYQLAADSVWLDLEVGDAGAARRAAQDFVERHETWTGTALLTTGITRALWLMRLAAADSEAIASRRAAWIDERVRDGATPGVVWIFGWAAPARTSSDATAALAALTGDPRLGAPTGLEGALTTFHIPDSDAGHVYLLADRAAEAVPYLKRAVTNCNVLSAPFEHVHAALDLGSALEKLGDRNGACAAYAEVVSMWGAATPRSVSATAARAGMARLRCASKGG